MRLLGSLAALNVDPRPALLSGVTRDLRPQLARLPASTFLLMASHLHSINQPVRPSSRRRPQPRYPQPRAPRDPNR